MPRIAFKTPAILVLGVAGLLGGCPPGPPPLSATGTAKGSLAAYTITATLGKSTWTYAVTGVAPPQFTLGFDSFRLHSPSDISDCELTLVGSAPTSAITVSMPAKTDLQADFKATKGTPNGVTAWTSATYKVKCGMKNDDVNITLTDVTAGKAESVVVGPIAGPQ